MTVIVVLLVTALVAFFSIYVGPGIRMSIRNDGNCSDAVCPSKDQCSNGICECDYYEYDKETHKKKTTNPKKIRCPYKG